MTIGQKCSGQQAGRRRIAPRARGLAALLVLLTVSIVAVPTPKSADAALYNLFPADSFGFPQGRFELDDAMFVTLTSDLSGGVVCVVPASVTNPAASDCVEPAWGDAKTYLGAGTMLGIPFKAPPLKAGTWRLLAAPIPAQPGSDLYEQFKQRFDLNTRQNMAGYELSEPFEVVNCTGPCDTSVATSQLAPWKARATKQTTSAVAAYTKLAVDIGVRTYKIMDAFYEGVGMGMGWGLLAAGWAGMGFDFVVPSTVDLAKGIWGDLSTATAAMWDGIAADPPDPNFATVADPVFTTPDHVGDEILDAYSDTLMRVEAYGTASRVANERYMGAVAAGDHAAAEVQAQAASDFTSELVTQLKRQQIVERLMATQSWANQPIISAPDGTADPAAWWASMVDGLATLTPADLTATDRQALRDQGLTDAQIDQVVATWSDPEFVDAMSHQDVTETMADVLRASADELDDTITTYQSLAAWMSYNQVVEHAQVPAPVTNHPPVSKFSASALTGTSPLTVTFTSQATDPDGDPLDLAWDIAGTRKESGATSITHTFTQPGTYGVSLVASDPDGDWDQAVKWITVYPDSGTTPDPNRPPVAYFTPQMVDAEGPITQTFKSNSFDPDGDPITATWYFGDGTTMTGDTVTKTFPPGYIMSVLLVVSDGSLTGQASGEVTSRHPGGPPITNQAPVPSFTADPSSGTSPLQVHFASTSTDPDGDPLSATWHFGDGDTATGPTATHTYTAAGTYTATLVVSDGTNSASTTRTVTVDAVSPIHAAIGISGGFDAAAAANGARMLDTGVPQASNAPIVNIIAPSGSWYAGSGVAADTDVIIRLAGDGRDALDQVRLHGPSNGDSVKTFSIALSSGSDPMSGYETVVDHATLPNDATPHAYDFTPRTARYLRLRLHDNYSGGERWRLDHLWAPTRARQGGVVSYLAGNPATIVSAPTWGGSYSASNLLEPSGEWRPGYGLVNDQRVVVRVGASTPLPISTFVLRAPGGSENPKNFQIWGSDTGADGTWTKLVDAQMNNSNGAQSFPVAGGPSPRFVELRFADTQGSATHMRVNEFQAVTEYGLNVADGAGVAAKVVDFSGERYGNVATTVLRSTPSASGGFWWAAGSENQFITVLLNEQRVTAVDHVTFDAGGSRPRHVRVETSPDGVHFSVAAAVELADVGSADQTVSFAPTQARFVRVVFVDTYGGGDLTLGRLRIYDAASGGAENVPFIDESTGSQPATAWHWDFGDGTTSTAQHPVHTFPGPGTYTVTLAVTDEGGNTDTTTTTYTVPGAAAATLSLTTSADEQPNGTAVTDEGVNVTLTASDSLHSAAVWDWDLGYTTLSGTGATITAKFPDDGTYVMRYRALGATGVSTPWATKTFVVRNVPPTVSFSQSAFTIIAGESISTSVSLGDIDPLRCTWDWGDGTAPQPISGGNFGCTWASASIPHTYAEVGDYTAKLIVDDGVDTTVGAVAVTVNHRPTVLQVVDASETGADLSVTGRLLDSTSGTAVGGIPASVGADGSAPVASATDPNGFIHVTLPGAAGANVLHLASAETSVYASTALDRLVDAPKLDLVFLIDASASMDPYRQAVRDNLWKIAQALGQTFDYRIGVVGYATSITPFGEVRTLLTSDLVAIRGGIQNPVSGGQGDSAQSYMAAVVGSGFQWDDDAQTLVEDNRIGLSGDDASCAVLVSDANVSEVYAHPGNPNYSHADHAEALDALNRRGMTLFSLIDWSQATRLAYGDLSDGQGGGGLALLTGGDAWSIASLGAQADTVLGQLTTKCGRKAGAPDLSVGIAGPSGVQSAGSTVTWTVTGANEGKVALSGVVTSVELPDDVAFTSATDGGVYDPATRTVNWNEGPMAAGATTSHSVTVEVSSDDWGAGDHVRTAKASIADDGAHGPEIDDTNNTATHAVTVHVERDIPPTTTSTSTTTTSTTTTLAPTTTTTIPPTTTSTTTTSTTTSTTTTTTSTSTTTTLAPTTTVPETTTTVPPTTTSTTTPSDPTTTVLVQVGPTDTGHVPSGPPVPSLPSAAPLPPGAAVNPTPQASPEGELPRTGPPVPATDAGLLGSILAMLGAFLVVLGRRGGRRTG